MDAAIAEWIERQPDPKPSKPEAIRRLVALGLNVKACLLATPGGDEQVIFQLELDKVETGVRLDGRVFEAGRRWTGPWRAVLVGG